MMVNHIFCSNTFHPFSHTCFSQICYDAEVIIVSPLTLYLRPVLARCHPRVTVEDRRYDGNNCNNSPYIDIVLPVTPPLGKG